jgi:KipI family sensor histidine kinase inhibitor
VFGDALGADVHRRVRAASLALAGDPPRGIGELVPAYTTIAVWYDPLVRGQQELAQELVARAAAAPDPSEQLASREWRVPVRYDGPDLAEVADRTGLSVADVIARHTGRTYEVYLLGFVPGFAFLGELDPSLVLPRRSPPRQRVPAGSVAIAGAQTGIYPLETPGGWHLLGRTDLELFDPMRDPPALFRVGDRVRFEALS